MSVSEKFISESGNSKALIIPNDSPLWKHGDAVAEIIRALLPNGIELKSAEVDFKGQTGYAIAVGTPLEIATDSSPQ